VVLVQRREAAAEEEGANAVRTRTNLQSLEVGTHLHQDEGVEVGEAHEAEGEVEDQEAVEEEERMQLLRREKEVHL
jgi:divalent metal cation (Fe/Co/Zn/Cd) transporter